MNRVDQSLRVLFGAVLLASAASSVAMSLGRMRGAAIVGRPLDVTVTAQLGESSGIADACVAADVFFGDSQLASGRVRVSTSTAANPGEALIRIATTFSVDEPVVTVYVREGCGQQITRKYVLLAELLSDNVESPLVSAEAVPAANPPARTDGQPSARTAQGNAMSQSQASANPGQARRASSPARTGTSNGSSAKLASTPSAVPAVPRAKIAAVAKPSGPRLKLDPVDLKEPERQPVLRSSSELLTAPAADPQQRAAAAGLWQALNAPPEEMMRDAARLKTLEDQMASIVAQNRSIEKAVTELGLELKEARSQRYNNWLVYLLGALLLLAVAGLVFLLRGRQQRSELSNETWWRKVGESDGNVSRQPLDWNAMDQVFQESALMQGSDSGERVPAAGSINKSQASGDQRPAVVSATPGEAPKPPRQFKPVSSQGGRSSEFSPSLSGLSINIPRAVNAEELFDVQQQADFFLSLGDSAKAVEVLRQHIDENSETSALAYLDLFEIYQKLKRRDDYELLRGDFNRIFNAQVPAFDDYAADANGLEFYASALSRIESLWPNSKVLDVLEESIFRKPDSGSEVFSIAAYRELLLLHAIAKSVVSRSNGNPDTVPADLPELPVIEGAQGAPEPNRFRRTKMEPLPAGMSPPVAGFDLTNPRPSSRLGVDIDLNQFPGEEAATGLPDIAPTQVYRSPEAVASKATPAIDSPPVDTSLLEFNLDKLDPWRL